MIFYYDRISVKRELIQKFINIMVALLMKLFQKDVTVAMYFFIIERILTIRNRPVIDVTKSY